MSTAENPATIFPKGDKASPDYFTGNVWIKGLVGADDAFHTQVANVIFEAGARNHWHTHPGGQILIATAGTGYYQERGKPVQRLQKGDVVKVLPEVEHWHGATPDSEFTHIAINTNTQKGVVEWLEPVNDEEYNSSR
jgi:quercetin dioxygenase-like cupin family protein